MNLREVLENAGAEVRSYSGRAMYGEQCLAIDGDESELQRMLSDAACGMIDVACDDNREELGLIMARLLKYKSDSMGRGVVYYWPEEELLLERLIM